MRSDGPIGRWGGQEMLVGKGAGNGRETRGKAGDAGGEPGLRGDGDLGATGELGGPDAFCGMLHGGGNTGRCGTEVEPGFFFFNVADELGPDMGAGAHKARADRGDANAFGTEFGVKAF